MLIFAPTNSPAMGDRSFVRRHHRRALTLVEMMVSLVCVILLMLAYTQLFAEAGARISDARGSLEMSNRLRTAAKRLQDDLAGLTAQPIPWARPESGSGYIEIIEGPSRDTQVLDDSSTSGVNEFNISQQTALSNGFPLGDTDDILMMTVRSKSEPFLGRVGGNARQSEVAEVVWFLRPTFRPDPLNPAIANLAENPTTYTLYRRVFLVAPSAMSAIPAPSNLHDGFYSSPVDASIQNDLSVHRVLNGAQELLACNTLADLTKRENRFGHRNLVSAATRGFPHPLESAMLIPYGAYWNGTAYEINTQHSRYGEDVVLTNVLAFDVQVWDPTAPVYVTGSAAIGEVAVAPGDPGFAAAAGTFPNLNPPQSLGAFVDLNWASSLFNSNWETLTAWDTMTVINNFPTAGQQRATSPFYSTGHPKSQLRRTVGFPSATYDPWSFHYEHDGIDQNQNGLIDEGTNGFDDDTDGVVDDPDEYETSPPYPVPLRGMRIRIRVYEPDTRQVREVSVVHSFMPE